MKLKLTPEVASGIKRLLADAKEDERMAKEHEFQADIRRTRAASNEMLAKRMISAAGQKIEEFEK